MVSLHRLLQSFRDALRGVVYVFKNEQNFRIQFVIALLVIAAVIYFPLHSWEVVLLVLLMVMVLTMELLNSAVERLSDLLKPRLHHYVGTIKDMMAAAVLITSLGALIVGVIIIWPYFMSLLK